MHYRLADYVLWFLPTALQAGVLLAMYCRGLLRRYPFFFNYTILQVASTCILVALAQASYTAYYYAYYWNLALNVVIAFAVSWEIIKRVLRRPRPVSARWFATLCAFALLIETLGLTLMPKSLSSGFIHWMMLGDRSLRLLQAALFLGLIIFSKSLNLSWKSITFGLATGFGLLVIVSLVVATQLSHHGFLTSMTLSKINSVAYLVAVVIWLFYVIFGFEDESGMSSANCLALRDEEDQARPKSSSRWFIRESVFGTRF
jgi:hypothetical protein